MFWSSLNVHLAGPHLRVSSHSGRITGISSSILAGVLAIIPRQIKCCSSQPGATSGKSIPSQTLPPFYVRCTLHECDSCDQPMYQDCNNHYRRGDTKLQTYYIDDYRIQP